LLQKAIKDKAMLKQDGELCFLEVVWLLVELMALALGAVPVSLLLLLVSGQFFMQRNSLKSLRGNE